ncbi:MAG: sugar phosphate isomerase/epimerase [Puniceicoccales bacterium]|jgi:sugar phosphate isomerase/epimerase|nr:sugar phosphate isomerase/epimerase [Puniceicoccales bacterium]
MSTKNNFPKLHNAAWPGVVGKGVAGAEPFIDLDTMLRLTASADVGGERFDGINLNLDAPHFDINGGDDAVKRLAEKVASHGLVIGSVGAPVWAPSGGGSAIGEDEERARFLNAVRRACAVARRLRELGIRPYGVVRIDSAASVAEWADHSTLATRRLIETFAEAARIAADHGEALSAEGEICWGGMHSWRHMLYVLERVGDMPHLGFMADMAHTLLFALGYNAPESYRLVPDDFHWEPTRFHSAMRQLTERLRPWTNDFHVAQNDATVKGSGTHDKTGRHCLPTDPNGKLCIVRDAGYWLRDRKGRVTKRCRHICWDGCMFPNKTLLDPRTWNDVLTVMLQVREHHGWAE